MIKTKTKEWALDRHPPSFFLDVELSDYISLGVLSFKDMEIADEQYTKLLPNWEKNQARFWRAEYNENAVPASYVDMVLNKRLSIFYIEQFPDVATARARLRDSTSLVETGVDTGVFQVWFADADTWEEDRFITID